MMFAVAAHVAAFVFWPGWENSDSFFDPDLEFQGTAWMALYAPPTSGGGGGDMATLGLALLEAPDSLPAEEVDAGPLFGGSGAALVGLPERLRQRLTGRGGPVPTMVQFGPTFGPGFGPGSGRGRSAASGAPGIGDDPTDTREEEEEDLAQTVEDATTEDLALLLETSPLDLSRLSAVRPQIVLPGTSAWILIRNPAEVDRFMNYAYGEDSEAEGLVDVAVWIDEWGSVEWAEISRSSGRQDMDEIALALFNEIASFRPARDRGVRVSLSAIFSVPFPW
jgi:TonB family protein